MKKSPRDILRFATLSLKTYLKKHRVDMMDIGISQAETFIAMDQFQQDHSIARISFEGNINGALFVTASPGFLAKLFNILLPDMKGSPPDQAVQSIVNELTSTVGGNLRHTLDASTTISLPETVTAKDINLMAQTSESAI